MEHAGKDLIKSKKVPPKGLLLLMLAGAIGVLLLLIGGSGKSSGEVVETEVAGLAEQNRAEALKAYTEALEEKIAALCSRVDGVSDVRVAVTLLSGYEYVYAKDAEASERDGGAAGSYHYITVGSGASESVVYVSEKPPRIGGIGIVCRGGGNAVVKRELIELIAAAFGVSSNRIYIAEGGG